ncbi:hypothetical protein KQI68_06910 [Peptoniphilus sp. MSJ-1]|uniref:Rad52/22 family double-strand break repair protein n=1 Tax=Peptoniphilus ovalis TaxID=2841503 RepID=A0ABS6FHD6_9FIRM|nr:hypothetical protein [Peptoniphilus ovalis]MBU5669569.1 hypothetical protein [Peptoniphilus ovalis]
MKKIRTLKPNEIDARVQSLKLDYIILVLYKDARVDMKILDETYGPMNWQRRHEVINNNLFCTVSVFDEDKQQWISKQDVGIPSNTQKEKGEASDAFKRACTNFGIGRELYTSPFIYIKANDKEVQQKGSKFTIYTRFSVKDIQYNDENEITYLEIIDNKGAIRFKWGQKQDFKQNEGNKSIEQIRNEIAQVLNIKKITGDKFIAWLKTTYGVDKVEKLNNQQLSTVRNEVANW